MSYHKAIIYGSILELYTYETHRGDIGGKRSGTSRGIVLPCVVEGGSVELQRQLQKRQDNQRRSEMAFRRLLVSNMGKSTAPLLVTVTYASNQTDITVAYEDWKAFIGSMRYKFGKDFRYVAVPEFQRRGAVHFHALFWGLPSNLCNEERSTRLVASIWGHGFVDVYQTDGRVEIAGYLAKYMSKAYYDPRMFGKQMYRCSRNIFRPLVEHGVGMFYLSEVYGIGVDNPPCIDKQFQTQWWGTGRYRYYKNIII